MPTPTPLIRRSLTLLVFGLLTLAVVACGSGATLAAQAIERSGRGANVPNAASLAVAAPGIQQAGDTPSGRILYVRDGNLWMFQGGTSRQFTEGSTWFQPAFSPDGKEIAYVYWANNFSDLFAMSADGSEPRRLTKGQSSSLADNIWAFRPAWSPDGGRIAYVSDANSLHPQVWVMDGDGGGRRQVTSEALGLQWVDALSWEPDGTRVAATAALSMRDASHIYLISVARGTWEKFSTNTNGAFDPSWSPNGESLAFIGRDSTQGQLTVRSLDGSKEARLERLQYVRSPVWSPDGKSLAVLAAPTGAFEVYVLAVKSTDGGYELGEPRQITRDNNVDPQSGLTWAP